MAKADAREWHEQQRHDQYRKEAMEQEGILLWYAGNKRKTGFPCSSTFRDNGFPEVAEKISQAYQLLYEASLLYDKQKEEMKHGDKLKLHIGNNIVQGIFQGWEGHDTIAFKAGREEFVTHYGSVVEINGRMV